MISTFQLSLAIRVEVIAPGGELPGAAAISPSPVSLPSFKGLPGSYPHWIPKLQFSRNEIVSLLVCDGDKMAAMGPHTILLSIKPSVPNLTEEEALASLLLPPIFTFCHAVVLTV